MNITFKYTKVCSDSTFYLCIVLLALFESDWIFSKVYIMNAIIMVSLSKK